MLKVAFLLTHSFFLLLQAGRVKNSSGRSFSLLLRLHKHTGGEGSTSGLATQPSIRSITHNTPAGCETTGARRRGEDRRREERKGEDKSGVDGGEEEDREKKETRKEKRSREED